MAIRKVARLGHPVLRKTGRDLSVDEIRSPETRRLIQDLVETMAEYGGIGIAAPQVHESLQLAILGFDDQNVRYPQLGSQPLTVVINPKITVLDQTPQAFWEGCLSVPGLRGLVERPRKIKVEYLDHEACPREIIAEGFLATVFQHELDHLNGVLFIDRVKTEPGKSPIAFIEEYEKYLIPESATGSNPSAEGLLD